MFGALSVHARAFESCPRDEAGATLAGENLLTRVVGRPDDQSTVGASRELHMPNISAGKGVPYPRIPGGQHGLAPELVRADQLARIHAAMVQAAAERGYVATTVEDVISRAGVSRRTFYEHYENRQDCLLAACDIVLAGWMREWGRSLTRRPSAMPWTTSELACGLLYTRSLSSSSAIRSGPSDPTAQTLATARATVCPSPIRTLRLSKSIHPASASSRLR